MGKATKPRLNPRSKGGRPRQQGERTKGGRLKHAPNERVLQMRAIFGVDHIGQPATLAGETIVEVPDMPAVAANSIAALYGDMEATYLVVDRVGIRVLRDPYTNKPFVHFYTTKRVGGGVYNPEPMRALKVAAAA